MKRQAKTKSRVHSDFNDAMASNGRMIYDEFQLTMMIKKISSWLICLYIVQSRNQHRNAHTIRITQSQFHSLSWCLTNYKFLFSFLARDVSLKKYFLRSQNNIIFYKHIFSGVFTTFEGCKSNYANYLGRMRNAKIVKNVHKCKAGKKKTCKIENLFKMFQESITKARNDNHLSLQQSMWINFYLCFKPHEIKKENLPKIYELSQL